MGGERVTMLGQLYNRYAQMIRLGENTRFQTGEKRDQRRKGYRNAAIYVKKPELVRDRNQSPFHQNLVAGSSGPNGPYFSPCPRRPSCQSALPLMVIVGVVGEMAVFI